jgi:Uma2 family endonuclease
MSLAKLKSKVSIEDYLEGEEAGEVRHEFIYGEVYAMAGTSDRHNRIAGNLFSKIDSHLGASKCETFIENIKLRADELTFYYPDIMVACDESPESIYYRKEPILLVEVLSPSSVRTDRHEKLSIYKGIPSLQEYLIVWQNKIYVEIYRRQKDDSWITEIYDEANAELTFNSIELTLSLEEVYRRVTFDTQNIYEIEF